MWRNELYFCSESPRLPVIVHIRMCFFTTYGHYFLFCKMQAYIQYLMHDMSMLYGHDILFQKYNFFNKLYVIYLNWMNIMTIKYIFFSRIVIQTHFNGKSISKYGKLHSNMSAIRQKLDTGHRHLTIHNPYVKLLSLPLWTNVAILACD